MFCLSVRRCAAAACGLHEPRSAQPESVVPIGRAGVDRPLAGARAGDLLAATAADGQALWLEVLAPAPEHAPAPQARAGAGACADGAADSRPGGSGNGDAEQDAPPSTSGRSGSIAGDGASGLHASTVLVAACCGERLELHPDGPGCFMLRHAGAAYSSSACVSKFLRQLA